MAKSEAAAMARVSMLSRLQRCRHPRSSTWTACPRLGQIVSGMQIVLALPLEDGTTFGYAEAWTEPGETVAGDGAASPPPGADLYGTGCGSRRPAVGARRIAADRSCRRRRCGWGFGAGDWRRAHVGRVRCGWGRRDGCGHRHGRTRATAHPTTTRARKISWIGLICAGRHSVLVALFWRIYHHCLGRSRLSFYASRSGVYRSGVIDEATLAAAWHGDRP